MIGDAVDRGDLPGDRILLVEADRERGAAGEAGPEQAEAERGEREAERQCRRRSSASAGDRRAGRGDQRAPDDELARARGRAAGSAPIGRAGERARAGHQHDRDPLLGLVERQRRAGR